MAKRPKQQPVAERSTVSALLGDAFSELETLGTEYRDWHENLPDSLKDHRQDICDAADTLEGLSAPDAPDAVAELEVSYFRNRTTSRASRGGQASHELGCVVAALEEWLEKKEAAQKDQQEDSQDAKHFAVSEFQEMGTAIVKLLDAGAERVEVLDDRGGSNSLMIEGRDADGNAFPPAASIEDLISEVETFRDEVQALIDEVDGVEWPGMYA